VTVRKNTFEGFVWLYALSVMGCERGAKH
jgi:hypothetical protein